MEPIKSQSPGAMLLNEIIDQNRRIYRRAIALRSPRLTLTEAIAARRAAQ